MYIRFNGSSIQSSGCYHRVSSFKCKCIYKVVQYASWHPVYTDATKTFAFFDIIHLIKNIRKNLLNQKKFVCPSFQLGQFRDAVDLPEGFISRRILHELYNRVGEIQVYLRKTLNVRLSILNETT